MRVRQRRHAKDIVRRDGAHARRRRRENAQNGAAIVAAHSTACCGGRKDGAIVGETTAANAVKHNTFLVWTDGTPDNFQLTCKFKIKANNDKGFANSGIQYRSRVNQPGESGPIISGYQADMEAGKVYTGILYEERGRGILAKRGEKTVRKSQCPIVALKRGNGLPDPVERRGCRVVDGELEPRRGRRASSACHRETTKSCEGQRCATT